MPLVIGIAGGTGSGKSTIAHNIKAAMAVDETVAIVEMDAYYKDHSHLSDAERESLNYDHPDAIDFELFAGQLKTLIGGKTIDKPIYDFVKHGRRKDFDRIEPADIIIVEGILTFHRKEIRDLFDIKLFVDTDPDIRAFRRIRRDIEVRGRKFEQIRKQYYDSVKPMHAQFVEPSKRWADLVLPEGGENVVAVDMIVSKIKRWIVEHRMVRNAVG